MDNFLQHEKNMSAWQAANLMFLMLFKEKLMMATNRTECTHVQPPKELTSEALTMIVVMITFGIFAVLGSLSTAYEFFYEENTERKKLIKNTLNKNFTYSLSMKCMKKILESDVNNKDCTNKVQVSYKKSISIRQDCLNSSRSFLHCFCFIKNGKRLLQTDPGKNQLECFHGIRVLSNLSIICFHVGLLNLYTTSADELKPFLQRPISKLLFNTYFGVNAFFVLSGFLNAYSFSNTYDKNNGKICWWYFYLKRLFRFYQCLFFVQIFSSIFQTILLRILDTHDHYSTRLPSYSSDGGIFFLIIGERSEASRDVIGVSGADRSMRRREQRLL